MHAYLVRHGQKQPISHDPALTEFGQKQAEATAEYFSHLPVDILYASPLQRAQQTAHAISEKIHLPVITDIRLRERIELGDDYEHGLETFLADWHRSSADRDYQPLAGHSSRKAGSLLLDLVSEAFHSQKQNGVFVCHGGVIQDMARNLMKDEELVQEHFHTQEKLLMSDGIHECSITELETNNGKDFTILSLFSVKHLPADLL